MYKILQDIFLENVNISIYIISSFLFKNPLNIQTSAIFHRDLVKEKDLDGHHIYIK